MEDVLEQLKKYINAELTWSMMYPENAELFEHNAFGALELACTLVDEDTRCNLENWWTDEIMNLFHQSYK